MSEFNYPLSTKPMWIEPRLKPRGTQLAGWIPKPDGRSMAKGILFDENVEIVMRDGTRLVADLFRPAGGDRVPVLISWAAYVKESEGFGGGPFPDEAGVCPLVIKNGYAILRVQPRGTGGSPGEVPEEMFTPQERQDCHDSIEWAARQPWCNGKVGMTGMSYFAISQLLVATTRPPSLTAIFPYKGFTDAYRHGMYKGGAVFSGIAELFAAFEKLPPPKVPAKVRHALSHVLNTPRFEMDLSDVTKTERNVRRFLAKKSPPEAAVRGYVSRLFDTFWDDGEFWRSKSAGPIIEQIDVPVCIATDFGAQDIHLPGAFDLWHKLKADKWLFIGPPEYKFPWSNYQEELIAWYDFQLKGIDNGYADLPRVRYYLRGADRWEGAANWPVPGAKRTRLSLAAAGNSALQPQALTTGTALPSKRSYLAVPSTSYLIKEVNDYEAQVLHFQTTPFQVETRIVGPVTLSIQLETTALDTYVIARLSDIAPDGTRLKLSWGWLMASHRKIDAARSNPSEIVHDHTSAGARQLVPGEITEVRFSLNPIASLFKPGHRLVLEIGARPELLSTVRGEGFDMWHWDPVPYRSRNTLHLGGDHPSFLEVELLDGAIDG